MISVNVVILIYYGWKIAFYGQWSRWIGHCPPLLLYFFMSIFRTFCCPADNQDEEHQSLSSESSGENPLEFSDDSMDEDYLPDMDLSPKRDGKRDGKRGEKRGGKSREESDVGTSRNKHRALRSTDRKRQRIPGRTSYGKTSQLCDAWRVNF